MIYIMSWREHIVFRYDAATLKEVDQLPWKRAGWGLTHNNSHLIISDGSSSLYIVNESLDIMQEI
jgi:glutamine cyclotransferase